MNNYILRDTLNKSSPVELYKQCTLTRCGKSFSSTLGPHMSVLGEFIKDRGKLLDFKTSLGYIESVSKWDIKYGGYKVEYK